jgi:hypothetical protein
MTLNEIQATARAMGLNESDVKAYGSLNKKATWEAAIAHAQSLEAEAQAENQAAAAAAAYSSPSAAVVVPIAFTIAVGTTFLKGVAGTVELLTRR